MNYFGMTYEEVLNSPFQRLLLLATAIPKFDKEPKEPEEKIEKESLLEFAKANNLKIKK